MKTFLKQAKSKGKFEICMWLKIFSATLTFENVKFTFWHLVEWICDEWLRKLWYLILQAEEENISTCRRPTIRFSLTSNRGECIIIQKRFFPRWLKNMEVFVITVLKKESPISENSALLRIIAQSIIDIQIWFFSGGRQLFMCEFS